MIRYSARLIALFLGVLLISQSVAGEMTDNLSTPVKVVVVIDGVSFRSNPEVKITTTAGDILLELFAKESPMTVKNFLHYVNEGSYAGTIFHRVIPDFMIQGGGHTIDLTEIEAGQEIVNEAKNGLSNLTGTIAMARNDYIDSASRQFFINTADNTRLDHSSESCSREDEKATQAAAERGLSRPVTCESYGYAVFGRVIEGMDVVHTIELVDTEDRGDYYDVPVTPVVITGMRVVNGDAPVAPVTTSTTPRIPSAAPSVTPNQNIGIVKSTTDANRPDLVVLIAIDQFRNDRIDASLPGGLGRLAREGRRFTDASLDHGLTNTCPGHSVMMTGVNPGKAGIPGNSYINRAEWEEKYCVEDDSPENRVLGGSGGRSPWMLQVPTLGEWVKSAINGRSYSVSGKDRAAIMMAGHKADGVYWFDRDQVQFTTSGYYDKSLPDFITNFNSTLLDSLPTHWEHGAGRFRLDDYEGESEDNSRVSGHQITAGDEEELGDRIYGSPFLDTQTMALARTLVTEKRLGNGKGMDLLTISLSANDTVGHQFGPYSAESEDTLTMIDTELAGLFRLLDEQVGKGRYLVALTSDHGVANLPEWQTELGQNQCPVDDGRIGLYGFIASLLFEVYTKFTFPFDPPTDLVKFSGSQLYINRVYLEENELEFDQVVTGLTRMLEQTEGVRKLWTRDEIQNSESEEARLLRNSIVEGASGDLFLQLEQDCIASSTGTTHGTLYDYDRSIPLIFYGFGVQAGDDPIPAHSIDITPTLMKILGLPIPLNLDGNPLNLAP